jgi:hypothetical protein
MNTEYYFYMNYLSHFMFLFHVSEIRSLAASHIHQTTHTCTCKLITRLTQHTYASELTHMCTSTHAQTHTYRMHAHRMIIQDVISQTFCRVISMCLASKRKQ